MARTCAILDDYQNVALEFADWSRIAGEVEVTVFNAPLGGPDEVVRALADFDIICLMRERTGFAHGPRADACGSSGGLRRLPAQHLAHETLSTARHLTGILAHVHSAPRESLKLLNSSLLGRGRMDNLLQAHT